MNSGSSAPISSGVQSGARAASSSLVAVVAAGLHRHVAAGDLHHDHVLDARAGLQRLVRIGLQRHLAPAAAALIGGDQHRALAVLDAVGQAVRREAAEHDGMHRAEPGAGEHRHRRLDHHRQIDRDPVAALDAEPLQRVRQPADLVVQLAVGDRLRGCSGRRPPR